MSSVVYEQGDTARGLWGTAVVQAITGIMVSATVQAAVKLGVFDALSDQPVEIEALATQLEADADALARLLRPLGALGLVARVGNHRVVATDTSRLLRGDVPGGVRGLTLMAGDEWYWAVWRRLDEAVRTGVSVVPALYGKDFFAYLSQDDPQAAAHFDAAMTDLSDAMNEPILAALDMAGVSTIADLGGGRGSLLRAVLERCPDVEGVLLDLEPVLAGADPALRNGAMAGRCRLVPGDCRHEVAITADVYLIKRVLHMWDDDTCVAVLHNITRHAPAGARVVVIEQLLTEGPEGLLGALMDLQMLVDHGGRERTAAQFAQLFSRAGLEFSGVSPTGTTDHLVVGRVPAHR